MQGDMWEGRQAPLVPAELERFSRHLILPGVGLEGQRRLKGARVLLVGAGGLGSPLALYLTAAGVGTLGLVDFDVVDLSNLQRQILYGTKDVGRPKLEAARDRLLDMNPGLNLILHQTPLQADNALSILQDYDIIADGTDNFATRYLVNDACVLLKKPNVYGSIFRFEGQASVFWVGHGPCYRCLYPEPPPPGLVPSCAEGGVLGILPGLLGVIQATEVIKLILGAEGSLLNRLLLVDAWGMSFKELKIRRNPACPLCGDHPTIQGLGTYEAHCAQAPSEAAQRTATRDGAEARLEAKAPGARPQTLEAAPARPVSATGGAEASCPEEPDDYGGELTVEGLKARLEAGKPLVLLDVRLPEEWEKASLPGAVFLPLHALPGRIHELSPEADIVAYCHHGIRSLRAMAYLMQAGFPRVRSLKGGIEAWARRIDPTMPRY